MSINQIAQGFYNSLVKNEQELYEYRIEICKKCKLFKKDNILGNICNSKLYLNPITEETSIHRQKGFNKGCGCVLKAKCRVRDAKCPNNKW